MSRYVQSLVLADRVYRLFMESVKYELKRLDVNDINNVQAIILYNIGEDRMTIGDLIQRKYYLGSNVTYNLKKMVDAGYVDQEQSEFDKRASYVSLTDKGRELYQNLDRVFQKHLEMIKKDGLEDFSGILKEIEVNLTNYIIS
ncbi:MAG: winged helix DNA-binding protein [Pseudomonadota bacterium]